MKPQMDQDGFDKDLVLSCLFCSEADSCTVKCPFNAQEDVKDWNVEKKEYDSNLLLSLKRER